MKDSSKNIAKYHLHKAHPEKLQFEIYDLNTYRKHSGEKAAIPHSHSYYQIIWFFNENGMHHVDFETLKRTPKASVGWYRNVIKNRGF